MKPTPTRWLAVVAFLALCTMMGCQGFSAAPKTIQTPTPGELSAAPASLGFGSVQTGQSQTLPETLTNTGGSTVTISQAPVTGSAFKVTGLNLPATLSAGQSINFNVVFSPTTAGGASGNISVSSDASNPSLVIDLSGTGSTVVVGQLSVTPATVSLGNVIVGSSGTASGTLNASGTSVTVTAASSNNARFTISGLSLPVTIAAGQSKSFTVTFSPQASGAASATLTFSSDASPSTTTGATTGTGVAAAGQLTVTPGTLNLGNVVVGSSGTASGSLNASGASVTVTSATSNNARFAISGLSLPVTIAAGQSVPFTVTFSPQAAGSASATLTFNSDASPSTSTGAATGTGVAAAGQLTVTPGTLNLGNVVVGNSGTASGSLNASGASVTVTSASSNNGRFTISGLSLPVTIAAGQSVPFIVTFSPQTTGSANATLTFSSDASPSTSTGAATGTGIAATGQLSVTPATLNLGNVVVGSGGTASGTLNATGANVTLTSASSNNARFVISGLSFPVTIAAGQSASFTVTFSPQSAGAASATLTFNSDASPSTTTGTAAGTGVIAAGQLTVSPTTLNVGNVVVGTSGTASGTLNATGASVTVTAATSNNSRFTLSGLSLPVTIPAGQSASFTVTFSPQVTGSASATLTFTSDASPSTTTSSATGTGTAAPVHTVNLTWIASTTPDVAGYNIYRAPFTSSCGSYAKLNSTLNTSTTYTDSAVTDGTTYCYATTAVDSNNQESGFSNAVQAVIPAP